MSVNSDESVKTGTGKKILGWLGKGLLLIAIFLVIFVVMAQLLRRIAIAQISELTNTKFKAKSIDINFDGTVFIEGLVVRPNQEQKYDDAILRAERVYARFGAVSLLLLRPRLKEINVQDFIFNALHDLDTGRWNLAALKIGPRAGGGKMPLIQLEKGILRYCKASGGRVKVAAAMPLDAEFGFDEKTEDGYRFNIITAERISFGKSTLEGLWRPGKVTITGGISSANVAVLERAWAIDVLAAELTYDTDNSYLLKLRVRDLLDRYKPVTATSVGSRAFLKTSGPFASLQKFFYRYRPWGRVDIDLEASGNLGRLSESKLVGKVYCKDASICDRKFPYTIAQLSGQIDFTEAGVSLNNLRGRHGGVDLCLNGWLKNFGAGRQYEVRITSENMLLDDDLYKALGPKTKKCWSAFSPSGLVAIDRRLICRSPTDKEKVLSVQLLGVEATYRKFPYMLKNLKGSLLYAGDNLTISQLVSQSDERRVVIDGEVKGCSTDRPIYDIAIEVDNIPLDSALAEAFSKRQRYFYNQFDMSGLADANVSVFTPQNDFGPTSFVADVYLKQTSLRVPVLQQDPVSQKAAKSMPVESDASPLLISDISAKTVFSPGLMDVEDFRGEYGGGLVSVTGRILLEKEAEQPAYCLLVQGEGVELSDDLSGVLPAALARVLSKLQPRGKINFSANLNKGDLDDCPGYKVTVDCQGNSVNLDDFPYPLKDIVGHLTITEDSIKLDNIAAAAADSVQIAPNVSSIELNGQVGLVDNAFGGGRFSLFAEDVSFDELLGIALPEGLKSYYMKLSPTGRFGLNFEDIKVSCVEDGGKYIDLSGTIRLEDCGVKIAGDVTALDAVLKTKGLYKTDEGFLDGQVNLFADGLRIEGKLLSGLEAGLYYDQRTKNWLTDELIADFYGGKITGELQLSQPDEGPIRYLLQMGFADVDLKKFLSDTKSKGKNENSYSRGQMGGSLGLVGRVGDNHSRLGRCRLLITDMEVGKLSPLAKVLQVLQLTEPEDFAFDQMLVDSYIRGDRIFIEQFDLSGDSVAFNGSGWLDLRSDNVNLKLTARGRRLASQEPGVLQSLTEGLGRAVVRIDVTGDFHDPQVATTTLPVIKETLGILGAN